MFRELITVLVLLGTLAGCQQYAQIDPPGSFDRAKAEKAVEPTGEYTLSGSAFLRQIGGAVVTCAGFSVYLAEANSYSLDRLQLLRNAQSKCTTIHVTDYGDFQCVDQSGFGTELTDYTLVQDTDEVNFRETRRETMCDVSGRFIFENVKSGDYILETSVTWGVPGQYGVSTQGGTITKSVQVNGDKKVVMSFQ